MKKSKEINITKKIPLCKSEEIFKVFESFKITSPKGVGYFIITNLRFIFVSLKKGKSTKGLTWQEMPIQDVNGRISSGYGRTVKKGVRKFAAFLIFFALVALLAGMFLQNIKDYIATTFSVAFNVPQIVFFGVAGGLVLLALILFFTSVRRMFFIEVLSDHNYQSIIKLSNNQRNQELFNKLYITPSGSTNEMIRDLGKSIIDVKAQLNKEKGKDIFSSPVLVPGAKQYFVNLMDSSNNRLGQLIVNDGERVNNLPVPKREGAEFENWYSGNQIFNINTPVQSDLTLVAKWRDIELKLFKVTYMYGAGKIYAEVSIPENGLLKPAENPIRTGYEFDGWYYGEKVFNFSTPIRSDLTIIANWRPIKLPKYVVSFFLKPGSLFRKIEVTKGQFTEPFETPVSKGLEFTGWYIGEELFNFNNPVESNLNLFAGWHDSPSEKVAVQFMVDGKTYYAADIDKGSYAPRVELPQKQGFVFTGWVANGNYFDFNLPININLTLVAAWEEEKLQAKTFAVTYIATMGEIYHREDIVDGEVARFIEPPQGEDSAFESWYFEGNKYDFSKPVKKEITLIAKWKEKEIPLYIVNYFSMTNKLYHSEQILENGFAINLPIQREGYDFTGWYLDEELFDFSAPIEKDISLTANWEKVEEEEISVTFIADPSGDIYKEVFVAKGEVMPEVEAPYKDDFKFIGWFKLGKLFDFSSQINEKTILMAKWESTKLEKYTVTFLTTGGEIYLEVDVNDGEMITPVGAPEREGYYFTGWYCRGSEFNFENTITEDCTLVARWEKIKEEELEITVKFYAAADKAYKVVQVPKGNAIYKVVDPEREGFTFLGWCLNDEKYDFNKTVEEDLVLRAKWEEIKDEDLTVCFLSVGGEVVFTYTTEKGKRVFKIADIEREGFKFLGWYVNDVEYDFEKPVLEDLILTAKWEKEELIKKVAKPRVKKVELELSLEEIYQDLKNYIMSHTALKEAMNKKYEEFTKGKKTLCKLTLVGQSFKLYLNIDESEIEKKYTTSNEGDKAAHKDTPVVYRVRNAKTLKLAKDLLFKVMQNNGSTPKKTYVNFEYPYPFADLTKLTKVTEAKLAPKTYFPNFGEAINVDEYNERMESKKQKELEEAKQSALKEAEKLKKLRIEETEILKVQVEKISEADKLKVEAEREAAKLKIQAEREAAKIKAEAEKEAAKIKIQQEKEKEVAKSKAQAEKEKEAAKLKNQAEKEKEAAKLKAQKEKEKEAAKLKAQKEKEKEAAKLKAQKEKEKEAAKLKVQKEKEKEAAKLKAQKEKEKAATASTPKKPAASNAKKPAVSKPKSVDSSKETSDTIKKNSNDEKK